MSRWILAILSLAACALSKVSSSAGVVKNSKRTLHMLEPDVIIYTNEITFRPDERNKGKDVFFEYIVAEDYRNTLVDLVFFDARRMNSEPLAGEKKDSSDLYD